MSHCKITWRQMVVGAVLWAVLFLPASQFHAYGASRGIGVAIGQATGSPMDLYAESFALVIGVSRYTAGWPDLESVPAETEQISALLRHHHFEVTVVMDPDSVQLREAFNRFINNHGFDPDNRLLLFFSGHGHSRRNGTKGYLVPTDAPDPRLDDIAFLQKAIPMSQVIEWSRRIESKHALFVFDSCFSGTIFKSKSLPEIPPHISSLTAQPVRQFISAGSAGEAVPAQSVFVPSFIRALKGEADLNQDRFVTGTELGMYLHQKVLSYRSGQTPQYGKIRDPELDEGDVVFSVSTTARPLTTPGTLPQQSPPQTTPPAPPASLSAARPPASETSQNAALPAAPTSPPKERFVIGANGVILDRKSGLEWVVGPDQDLSFKGARKWARELSLDGGGWRLPTRQELRALYHKTGLFSRALPDWVTLSQASIWTSHTRYKMMGGVDYHFYLNGTQFTTASDDDGLNKRALSVRSP